MKIAFDAKRAYSNNTGLGNYARILTHELFQQFPQHDYYLVTPEVSNLYEPPLSDTVHVVAPKGVSKLVKSLWRSSLVKRELVSLGIDLYHGLSHEIPFGIERTNIKTVVTMHDLIFERFPNQYKPADVRIYRKKFKNACLHSDMIISMSLQTSQDLIDLYHVPAEKIRLCYPSCFPIYQQKVSEEAKRAVRKKYNLPEQYFLSVGSVIERKNLLLICQAMNALKGKLDIPLVVTSSGDSYLNKVKDYVREHDLQDRIIFLADNAALRKELADTQTDMPAMYQAAHAILYPTIFEGFGLPVLEGLFSGVPVITSNVSCMPETGGDAAFYIDPYSIGSMANGMVQVATDNELRAQMIVKGYAHAKHFLPDVCAARVMKVYEEVMR